MKIKYRVWHKEFNRFLTPDEWFVDMNGDLKFLWIGQVDTEMMSVDPSIYIIDTFTGIKDKNGKEIYSKDFIKYSARSYKDNVAMVTWYDIFGCWGLFTKMSENLCNCYDIEIVGNAHQNTELFKHHHR